MRKTTLLVAAFLLTTAAVSSARAANASRIPPPNRCWVLVCDSEGVCVAKETFC